MSPVPRWPSLYPSLIWLLEQGDSFSLSGSQPWRRIEGAIHIRHTDSLHFYVYMLNGHYFSRNVLEKSVTEYRERIFPLPYPGNWKYIPRCTSTYPKWILKDDMGHLRHSPLFFFQDSALFLYIGYFYVAVAWADIELLIFLPLFSEDCNCKHGLTVGTILFWRWLGYCCGWARGF